MFSINGLKFNSFGFLEYHMQCLKCASEFVYLLACAISYAPNMVVSVFRLFKLP